MERLAMFGTVMRAVVSRLEFPLRYFLTNAVKARDATMGRALGLAYQLASCPCLTCSIKIVQVGISQVVYSQGYSMDQEVLYTNPTTSNAEASQTAALLHEANVKLRQYSPVRTPPVLFPPFFGLTLPATTGFSLN